MRPPACRPCPAPMRSKPGFSRPCRCLSHLGGNVDRSIAPLGSWQETDVLEDRRKIASKSLGKICRATIGRGVVPVLAHERTSARGARAAGATARAGRGSSTYGGAGEGAHAGGTSDG